MAGARSRRGLLRRCTFRVLCLWLYTVVNSWSTSAGRAEATMKLAGRISEIAAVVGVVEGAVRHDGGALLIFGEAGVGKTALIRAASGYVGDVADVLWAPCLPLTSLAVPFLPLTSAVRVWAADRRVLVPELDGSAWEDPTGFDAWLGELCRHTPALLVVDDLQWADQSSLDVLMYVLAGLAGRKLAVVATVRAGEEGPQLRRWLADVRRFPGVSELSLDRLDRLATGEQLAGLLGGPPHQSLVDDVFARTRGNAYLTTLMVRSLSPEARSLPAGLPSGLREATTQAWRGLSAQARALTALIAVAGRPQRADQLGRVAAAAGVDQRVVPLLREAVDGAVLDVGDDDTYWFVHPLLAEVLERALLPEERASLHAAFAAALDSAVNLDEMGVERTVDLQPVRRELLGHRMLLHRSTGSEAGPPPVAGPRHEHDARPVRQERSKQTQGDAGQLGSEVSAEPSIAKINSVGDTGLVTASKPATDTENYSKFAA